MIRGVVLLLVCFVFEPLAVGQGFSLAERAKAQADSVKTLTATIRITEMIEAGAYGNDPSYTKRKMIVPKERTSVTTDDNFFTLDGERMKFVYHKLYASGDTGELINDYGEENHDGSSRSDFSHDVKQPPNKGTAHIKTRQSDFSFASDMIFPLLLNVRGVQSKAFESDVGSFKHIRSYKSGGLTLQDFKDTSDTLREKSMTFVDDASVNLREWRINLGKNPLYTGRVTEVFVTQGLSLPKKWIITRYNGNSVFSVTQYEVMTLAINDTLKPGATDIVFPVGITVLNQETEERYLVGDKGEFIALNPQPRKISVWIWIAIAGSVCGLLVLCWRFRRLVFRPKM